MAAAGVPGDARGELTLVEADDPALLARWFDHCERRAEIECPACLAPLRRRRSTSASTHAVRLRELWPEMRVYR